MIFSQERTSQLRIPRTHALDSPPKGSPQTPIIITIRNLRAQNTLLKWGMGDTLNSNKFRHLLYLLREIAEGPRRKIHTNCASRFTCTYYARRHYYYTPRRPTITITPTPPCKTMHHVLRVYGVRPENPIYSLNKQHTKYQHIVHLFVCMGGVVRARRMHVVYASIYYVYSSLLTCGLRYEKRVYIPPPCLETNNVFFVETLENRRRRLRSPYCTQTQ